MTSANRIGVSSGTKISRGVCAVSEKRRRTSVASAPSRPLPVRRTETDGAGAVSVASISISPFRSGRGVEPRAGQSEVHVLAGLAPRQRAAIVLTGVLGYAPADAAGLL